jgi:transcriptional regulator with XRE-family HTH domain
LWRDVVGEVLREERQAGERTLQDVADAARISMPYLSEIERGRKEASSEVLAAATRALGISMTELLVRVQSRLVEYEEAAYERAVNERAVNERAVNERVGGGRVGYHRAVRGAQTERAMQAVGRNREVLGLAA